MEALWGNIMADNIRTIIFDESGNMGTDGRFFVIACIDTINRKSLHNLMKKKLLAIKKQFPKALFDGFEHKAKDANKTSKQEILSVIAKNQYSISYIVADLKYVSAKLLDDKNILYNYLIKLLVDELIDNTFANCNLHIKLDNKSIKVKSQNSFSDYINLYLNYEKEKNLEIDVKYIDSKSGEGFVVQAADYIANALYAYYEYGNSTYYDIIKPCINIVILYPKDKFCKSIDNSN
jgi:hypothetical protein